ncbi:c-type cytochrome [Gimesia aquarii]|uniref:Cytochrome c6 n=1 Tax=Gimesia aquarii TaxID=2527964 RepID=A0A517VWX0_9PLAN|nr:cytochrome c [Gimesia aquarii]QDT97496.1 Cytochrome c6 [Gimesia aquarii]
MRLLCIFICIFQTLLSCSLPLSAEESSVDRGYRFLTSKAYLPPDFDQAVFDDLWKVWPEELKEKAEKASPAARRKMIYSYYGIMERPDSKSAPLGYVVTPQQKWVMNCFTCHGGKVAGTVIPGAPNSHVALHTLTEDVSKVKLQQLKKLSHLDMAALGMPLGTTHGTTNSVIFGVILDSLRDPEMNFDKSRSIPQLLHHDMDPPAWWNVKRKQKIYTDAFVTKNHRVLMQFILVPQNNASEIKNWESDFADILAYIESLEAPHYRWDIDNQLAQQGKKIFNHHCARCHGTYGDNSTYPEKTISIDDLQTDSARLNSLPVAYRAALNQSWLSRFGKDPVVEAPGGYVAPPLNGVWASAPYFHNGSVPTLWHVLHPEERPQVWKRTENGYDVNKVGLEIKSFPTLPEKLSKMEKRTYFDTTQFGKSASGHYYPNDLDQSQKQAVLEYLKTL